MLLWRAHGELADAGSFEGRPTAINAIEAKCWQARSTVVLLDRTCSVSSMIGPIDSTVLKSASNTTSVVEDRPNGTALECFSVLRYESGWTSLTGSAKGPLARPEDQRRDQRLPNRHSQEQSESGERL